MTNYFYWEEYKSADHRNYKRYSTPWEFFLSALADGLLLDFKGQLVSLGPEDSSQHSARSQQYGHLDGVKF